MQGEMHNDIKQDIGMFFFFLILFNLNLYFITKLQ